MMGLPPTALPTKDALAGLPVPAYRADRMDYHMNDGGQAVTYYPDQSVIYPIQLEDDRPMFPQWVDGSSQQGQYQQLYQHQTPSHSSINNFASIPNINTATINPNPYTDATQFPLPTAIPAIAADTSILANSTPQHTPSPTIMNSIPSSWKGQGKQELLETLLETIGTCDEQSVAHVVQVIRTSASPEEAVSGICRVLGIGNMQ
jgi:hypothetical protein